MKRHRSCDLALFNKLEQLKVTKSIKERIPFLLSPLHTTASLLALLFNMKPVDIAASS